MKNTDTLQLAHELHAARRFAEAEAEYRQILATDPGSADALHGLGWLAHQVGQDQAALQLLERASIGHGSDCVLHWQIAIVSEALGQNQRADAAYARASELKPKERNLLDRWGVFLAKTGRLERAIELFRRTIKIDPSFAEGYRHLGMAFDELAKLPEAESAFRESVRVDPGSAASHDRLGRTLGRSNRIDEALEHFHRALAIDPNHFDANFNLGVAYRILGRHDPAIAAMERALAADPKSQVALNEMAEILSDTGEHRKAIPFLDRAIALNPGDSDLRGRRALSLLAIGSLTEGFKEYEWRWKSSTFPQNRRYSHILQWTGFDISGKTILLYTEQGYGDSIQFIRYAPLIAERGARVLLQANRELLPLLTTTGGIAQSIESDGTPPKFDVQSALLSLPFAFGTSLETIPANVPYLHADPKKIEQWKPRLDAPPGKRKIGLVWAGRPTHRRDRQRSIPPEFLAPLAGVSDAVFFSLQKGKAGANNIDGLDLVQLGPDLKDFADTAAVIAQLDLVISVDTAVVHLAGAMGRPVWTLLGAFTDFRWMLEREDSPWYPTMRLFRQRRRDDWTTTVERVVAELRRVSNSNDETTTRIKPE